MYEQIDDYLQDLYTNRGTYKPGRKEEMWNTMEQATSQTEKDSNYVQELARRRAFLATQFQSMPTYGSADFWRRIEECQSKLAPPLEVLVKCVRVA
jgi:hypothetical protein